MKSRRLIASLLLAVSIAILPAAPARADFVDTFFGLLKQYHPDRDGVEFARYYVRSPEHASVIYSRVASQDYVFAGILAAAKAARNQKILPGGKKFDEKACMFPINAFNAAFAKSGEFIEQYGEEEHVKSYLNAGNEELKEEAAAQIGQYVPYWGEIPSICHFTFNTEFDNEKKIRETLQGGWKLVRGAYDDFSSGNVVGGVAKLAEFGISPETACVLADNALTGGSIGKVPVVGDLAKGACAGFAGEVLKGISTAAGAVVNAVGEFIGDAACAAGIGSCTGNKPVDGIYNPNFELLVYNWMNEELQVTPEHWAEHWFAKIQGPRCHNQTGAPAHVCRAAFDQTNASAKQRAEELRNEVAIAYATIYKPKLNELVVTPPGLFTDITVVATCVANLAAKYPWPGPQQIGEQHNKVFRDVCSKARNDATVGGGSSFQQQVDDARKTLSKALIQCGSGDPKNPLKRKCSTYPLRETCVKAVRKHGVDRGTAEAQYCGLDAFAANVSLAKSVGTGTSCLSQTTSGKSGFAMRCGTYADQRLCISRVKNMPGVPDPLIGGCRVDTALANEKVMDTMSANLGLGAKLKPETAGCKRSGNSFLCSSTSSWSSCKAVRAKLDDAPVAVGRCKREVMLGGGTEIPGNTGGKVIPEKKLPADDGGAKVVPGKLGRNAVPGAMVAPPPPAPAGSAPTREQIVASLSRRGCSEVTGKRLTFECQNDAGFRACEMYRAKKHVAGCRLSALE